jgi:hypothetical protein
LRKTLTVDLTSGVLLGSAILIEQVEQRVKNSCAYFSLAHDVSGLISE